MIRNCVVLMSCLVSLACVAKDTFNESEIKDKALAFIEAKNARQQPDTTVKDIEHFLSLIADDFIDEHIKFNVVVSSKDALREGMINKLKDKVYFSHITVEQVMLGRNVAFVKYKEHAKVKPSHLDKTIEYTSHNILSLEFDEKGLIKHIRRHHGL